MRKLLTLGILFSAAVRAVVAAQLVILDISPLISFILALREALVATLVILCISPLTSFILVLKGTLAAKLVLSGVLSSTFLFLVLYISFLIVSSLLQSLVYLNHHEQVLIYFTFQIA